MTPITIAAWNIRRASYEQIADAVTDLACDVLVLQECAKTNVDETTALRESASRWRGRDPKTGLGVFTFDSFTLADPDGMFQHPVARDESIEFERMLPWVVPVEVTGDHETFNLLGVWADNSSSFRPATAAIRQWSRWLGASPSVVAGDFNNHRRWDHVNHNEKDHAVTVDLLGELGLVSAYHHVRGLTERADLVEEDMTHWTHYSEAKGSHIDFVYAPTDWIQDRRGSATVGSWDDYVGGVSAARLSDHAPVIADLEIPVMIEVPPIECHIDEVFEFACTYDGYGRHAGPRRTSQAASAVRRRFEERQLGLCTLDQLRTALFMQFRAWRHGGEVWSEEYCAYERALIDAIRTVSGGRLVDDRPFYG